MDGVALDNWMFGCRNCHGYGYGNDVKNGEGFSECEGNGNGSGEGEGNINCRGFGSVNCSDSNITKVNSSDYCDSSCDGFGDGFGEFFCKYCNNGYGLGICRDGKGCCDGNGFGSADGKEYDYILRKYEGKKVYYIDGIPCFLRHARNEYAYAEVINKDMRTSSMVIAKGHGFFAHGATVREAADSLERKIYAKIEFEEKKLLFLEYFNSNDKYPAGDFFDWHGILTGSCVAGRRHFVAERGIDLENDKMTRIQFFETVRDQYGWEIIAELANS